MNQEEAITILNSLIQPISLKTLELQVFCLSWEQQSYEEIAINLSYEPEYIKQVGHKLWKQLSQALGEKVTKANFYPVLKKYHAQVQSSSKLGKIESQNQPYINTGTWELQKFASINSAKKFKIQNHQDWGDAIDTPVLFGRAEELTTLQKWIVQDQCRLVLLLGMGGIGKTALAVRAAQQIQDKFEYLIFRNLRNSPNIEELLNELIQFLSQEQEIDLPHRLDGKILLLLQYLRSKRCLLILDNVETILQSGNTEGRYREGYSGYGQLLRCAGETLHNSCIVLTSRERPIGLAAKQGEELPIKCLQLSGLRYQDAQKLFHAKGEFSGTEAQWQYLIEYYLGNPLFLKIVAAKIQEYFEGDISQAVLFLKQNNLILSEIKLILEQQFQSLSFVETQILYQFASHQKALSFPELQAYFSKQILSYELLEACASLLRRSLMEKVGNRLSFKHLIMKYVSVRSDTYAR
jgi:NB-ARC domain